MHCLFSPFRLSCLDQDAALDTVHKIEELDAADNIFIILAHDESTKNHIVLFSHQINDWKAKSLRSQTSWLFFKDFVKAMDRGNETKI